MSDIHHSMYVPCVRPSLQMNCGRCTTDYTERMELLSKDAQVCFEISWLLTDVRISEVSFEKRFEQLVVDTCNSTK